MILSSLRHYRLSHPLLLPVKHHLAIRDRGDAIVIIAQDRSGMKGYGEGTPRHYVTGESCDGRSEAVRFFSTPFLDKKIESLELLIRILSELSSTPLARKHPSVFCAFEIACLDLWGRLHSRPLWNLFSPSPLREQLYYSAVLPMAPATKFKEMLDQIRKLGMKFVKIKISERTTGVDMVKLARSDLGPEVDIRVDANGAFTAAEALLFLADVRKCVISAIEQPVPKEDTKAMRIVSENGIIPVIADESACTVEDIHLLAEMKGCQGINIRLSKCGGILNSMKMTKAANSAGLFCQIGCHVGETAILSAAGRHLAALCPDMIYLEGSFSRYILREDISVEDISFGHEGRAPILNGPGLGIAINEAWIEQHGVSA